MHVRCMLRSMATWGSSLSLFCIIDRTTRDDDDDGGDNVE